MDEDVLKQIDSVHFGQIYNLLERELPHSLHVLNFIKNFAQEDRTEEVDFKVFSPDGVVNSGIVIAYAIFLNGYDTNFLMLHCSSPELFTRLYEVLCQTRRLAWDHLCLEMVPSKYLPVLHKVLQDKSLKFHEARYKIVVLPEALYSQMEAVPPDGMEFRLLMATDAEMIDHNWAYFSSRSYFYVRHSITHSGGVALVSTTSRELVSWAVAAFCTVGMVHTVLPYRGRGYASIIVRELSKKLINRGVQPTAAIKCGNDVSLEMFQKIGFVDIGDSFCLEIN